jgi:hypothetical protein
MSTTSSVHGPFHHQPRNLARQRWAFWLLLATGCGARTPLDLQGAVASPGPGDGTGDHTKLEFNICLVSLYPY